MSIKSPDVIIKKGTLNSKNGISTFSERCELIDGKNSLDFASSNDYLMPIHPKF